MTAVPRFGRRLPLLGIAAAVAGALLFSGCAGGDAEVDLSTELPTEIPANTKIVIADQQEQLQTLLAASGLDQDLPYEIEYANFTGGPAILEAFRAGSADVAPVGDVPPIHAQLTGQQVPIILAFESKPDSIFLASSPAADIRSLADLRGAKIAYAEGTAQQVVVLRALQNAGLGKEDVELVPLQLAEFSDALGASEVDVAPLNEPRLTRYLRDWEKDGASFIPSADAGQISQGLNYIYARGESLTDPAKAAALRHLVGTVIEARQWINDHPEEWIEAYFVRSQNVSAEDGQRILESTGLFAVPPLDDALIARQQTTIDVLGEFGELPQEVQAKDGFDLRFAPVIEAAAESTGVPREFGDWA